MATVAVMPGFNSTPAGLGFGVRRRLDALDVDHESSKADARAMEAKKTAILARPGLANTD
jgi:hypothetical protein